MKLKNKLTGLLMFLGATAFAQGDDGLGAWYIYNGSFFTKPNLEFFFEAQFRYREIVSNRQEIFFRPFGIYHFSKTANLGLGYMYDIGYADETFDNVQVTNENRILLQLILNTPVDRTKLQHRLRLEQRWIKNKILDDTDSRQRFRYRLMAQIPIGSTSFTKGTFFVGVYDELFIDLTGGIGFDQNRFYGGLGWQFSNATNFQLGYLLQSFSDANHSRLQIWFTQRLNFYDE
jgi:hypothetical protein